MRVVMARPARAPPRASEPVSPMKILAGEAFHQRKPKQAPITAAATTREVERVADLVALDAGVGLAVLVELPDADEDVGAEHHHEAPVASPSRPSVRFTPLDVPAIMR